MNPTIRFEKFALPETQANRLERYSNWSGVSKSEILRRSLDEYLEKREPAMIEDT